MKTKRNQWRQDSFEKPKRIWSPSDKAKLTKNRNGEHLLVGNITSKQLNLLIRFGFNGDVVKKWTKHQAHKQISAEIAKAKIEKMLSEN